MKSKYARFRTATGNSIMVDMNDVRNNSFMDTHDAGAPVDYTLNVICWAYIPENEILVTVSQNPDKNVVIMLKHNDIKRHPEYIPMRGVTELRDSMCSIKYEDGKIIVRIFGSTASGKCYRSVSSFSLNGNVINTLQPDMGFRRHYIPEEDCQISPIQFQRLMQYIVPVQASEDILQGVDLVDIQKLIPVPAFDDEQLLREAVIEAVALVKDSPENMVGRPNGMFTNTTND